MTTLTAILSVKSLLSLMSRTSSTLLTMIYMMSMSLALLTTPPMLMAPRVRLARTYLEILKTKLRKKKASRLKNKLPSNTVEDPNLWFRNTSLDSRLKKD